jgi:hypothetical protein
MSKKSKIILKSFSVVCREVLQMLVSLKRYVFDLENLVELVMIGLVAIILFLPDDQEEKESSCQLKRHLAAIALGKIFWNPWRLYK